MLYAIEFAPGTREHLTALTARHRALVLDHVERRLRHDPAVETRNRKPLRPKSLAGWELRIADLRVYYDVVDVPKGIVVIRAVGVKERERVRIGKRVGNEVLQDDEDAGRR